MEVAKVEEVEVEVDVEVEAQVVVVISGSSAVTVATTVSVTVGPLSVTTWVTTSVVTPYPGPPSTGTTEYGTCLFLISLSKTRGDNGRAFRVATREEATRRIVLSLSCIVRATSERIT